MIIYIVYIIYSINKINSIFLYFKNLNFNIIIKNDVR